MSELILLLASDGLHYFNTKFNICYTSETSFNYSIDYRCLPSTTDMASVADISKVPGTDGDPGTNSDPPTDSYDDTSGDEVTVSDPGTSSDKTTASDSGTESLQEEYGGIWAPTAEELEWLGVSQLYD